MDATLLAEACATWESPGPAGIAVVTACAARDDDDWKLLCAVAGINHAAYARRHQYGLLIATCALQHGRSDHWSKIPLLLATLAAPGVVHAFWTDSDSLFMELGMSLESLLPSPPAQLSFTGDRLCFLNSGHLMLRSGAWASSFLRGAWDVFPQPLPWNEQSALAFVLGGSRASCRASVLTPGCCGARALREPLAERKPKPLMNAYLDDYSPSLSSPILHLAGKLKARAKARLLAAYARRVHGAGGGGGSSVGAGVSRARGRTSARAARVALGEFHGAVTALARAQAAFATTSMHVSLLSPALADDPVERRSRAMLNRSWRGGGSAVAPLSPPALASSSAAAAAAAAFEVEGEGPSNARLSWRAEWAQLRAEQIDELERRRDGLDRLEPSLSAELADLAQLLPDAVALAAATEAGSGGSVGGSHGLLPSWGVDALRTPFALALTWQLRAGKERPHAEACALVNASEASGWRRSVRGGAASGFCRW